MRGCWGGGVVYLYTGCSSNFPRRVTAVVFSLALHVSLIPRSFSLAGRLTDLFGRLHMYTWSKVLPSRVIDIPKTFPLR